MDGGAGRAVPVIDPQDAALLLLAGLRKTGNHQQHHRGGTRLHAPHASLPRYFGLISSRFSRTISWRGACATSKGRCGYWDVGLMPSPGVRLSTFEVAEYVRAA